MYWEAWQQYAEHEENWRNHTEKGLLKAEYMHDFTLQLWFEEELDVTIYELDSYPLFVTENPGGVFTALRDQQRFRLVEGNYALIWLNPDTGAYDESAIDIAPECIRFFCERYGRQLKSVGHAPATEPVAA
ncbi:MAG: hypothetical protein R3C14_18645 [Caldilineaceae bacterium]